MEKEILITLSELRDIFRSLIAMVKVELAASEVGGLLDAVEMLLLLSNVRAGAGVGEVMIETVENAVADPDL